MLNAITADRHIVQRVKYKSFNHFCSVSHFFTNLDGFEIAFETNKFRMTRLINKLETGECCGSVNYNEVGVGNLIS